MLDTVDTASWHDQETDAEYFELADALDVPAAASFAVIQAAADPPTIRHYHAVSGLSHEIAAFVFSDRPLAEVSYFAKAASVAGHLHEMGRHGVPFERLTFVADELVAKVVGAITPDWRLDPPARRQSIPANVGRFGEICSQLAQVVILSDLIHTVEGLSETEVTKRINADRFEFHQWVDELTAQVGCLGFLDRDRTAPAVRTVRTKLRQLGQLAAPTNTRRGRLVGV